MIDKVDIFLGKTKLFQLKERKVKHSVLSSRKLIVLTVRI